MDLKWLHAPGHSRSIGPNVVKFATGLEPDVIDWSEMNFNTDDLLENAPGYHHFIGPPKRKDARGRTVNHDVVISLRSKHDVLYEEEFFVGREIPKILKYMPERWGKALVCKIDGEVVLIVAWHPQPGAFRWTKLVLPQYGRSVKRVEEVQRRLQKQFKPEVIMNGGDLQLGAGRRWVCPNKMAERLGMQWRNHKIDWQMYRGFGVKLLKFIVLDPSSINKGMDHVWTLMTLRKAN